MAARRKPSNAGKSVHGGYLAICGVCGCEYVERLYVDAVGGNCRCHACRQHRVSHRDAPYKTGPRSKPGGTDADPAADDVWNSGGD